MLHLLPILFMVQVICSITFFLILEIFLVLESCSRWSTVVPPSVFPLALLVWTSNTYLHMAASTFFLAATYLFLGHLLFKSKAANLSWKGHGNETDFLGFLHKPVRHRSLTLRFEPFRFWLQIRGYTCNRKTTPRLAESTRLPIYTIFSNL